jgi:hypothetical protein
MTEYLRLFDAESLRQMLRGDNMKGVLVFAALVVILFVLVVFVFGRNR